MPSRRTNTLRGNHFQDEIEKYFRTTYPGCAVHNQKPSGKRIFYKDKKTGKMTMGFVSVRNDIFGVFDLIVVIPGCRTKFIQATLDSGIGRKKEEIDKILFNPQYCEYEIWQKVPREGVRILLKYPAAPWDDRGKMSWNELAERDVDYLPVL